MDLDRTSLTFLLIAVALLGYMLGYIAGWLEAPAIVRTVYVPRETGDGRNDPG